nr:transglycosylase SLT domain-containing protein [uncultured Rhodopila sp.]
MRNLLCLMLVMPGIAMAGQDSGPRPVAARTVALLQVAPRPIARQTAYAGDPGTLCETAVTSAEFSGSLPPRLLHAISLTESGRIDPKTGSVKAWPWTLNAEGEGHFFETRDDAIQAVKALQARGVQSIDVGCTQVNLMYHPHAFASLEDAFDPRSNATYAARFLNALYAEGKDWSRAIAAYHSETPALGDAYRVLVMARWRDPDLREARPVGANAYQDFARDGQAYGAFTSTGRVYGAFTMGAGR